MTKILYGNEVALKIKEDLNLRIDKLKEKKYNTQISNPTYGE